MSAGTAAAARRSTWIGTTSFRTGTRVPRRWRTSRSGAGRTTSTRGNRSSGSSSRWPAARRDQRMAHANSVQTEYER
jgi:hypothetical protein